MKARPILFSGPMVRALLEGRKGQTCRTVKPQPEVNDGWFRWNGGSGNVECIGAIADDCRYGQTGDLLYVRETWRVRGGREYEYQRHLPSVMYHADDEFGEHMQAEWRPSIHMPKWASRLTLRITDVRVQRLQEISEEDAIAEGIAPVTAKHWQVYEKGHEGEATSSPIASFRSLWDSINGDGAWDANPWVWAIGFDVIKQNVYTVLREAA